MLSWTHIQDPPPNKRQQEDAEQAEARETKEAQESRMVELYDESITAQMEGRWALAKRNYRLILESPLLQEAVPTEQIHRRLKYLSLKNTAEVLEAEGEGEQALKSYAAAMDVDPTDVAVWLHIGRLCEQLSRLRAARHAYEAVVRQHAQNWQGLSGLARVLDTLGDKAAALAVVNRALRLDPKHPGMRLLRSRLRQWMTDPRAAAREDMKGARLSEETDDWQLHASSNSTLHVTLDRAQKRHAWAELGLALLKQGKGFMGNVTVEVEDRAAALASQMGGKRPAPRVTEEQRLQAIEGRGGAAETTGEGGGAMEVVVVVDEEDQAASEVASQPANPGRRLSKRQEERIQAREENERRETVTARLELSEWMGKHLEGERPAEQGAAAAADVWWEVGGQSGEEGGTEEDEGAALAKSRLPAFKGVHNSECDVCGDGGDLICCETCSTVYHTACLLRPPSLSEDLYCDRCREDAYKRAGRQPRGVTDLALFSSEVEEIVNEFLPSATPNLGPLDLMHRLVLRLARVQEALVWEDGTVRRAALEMEAASRPFARDLQVHTCHDEASGEGLMDFGLEGELFLAELHLDEVLLLASGAAKPPPPSQPAASSQMEVDGAAEAEGEEGRAQDEHVLACEVFVAKVFTALEAERRKQQGDGRGDSEGGGFDDEYLCRTFWLRGLLEAWRGRVKEATACLDECYQRCVDLGRPIDLPHCQRYPVLSADVVVGKRKELMELGDTEATRRLVQAFRQGAEASRGGSAQAFQALLSLVRRRFLLDPASPPGPLQADRRRKTEELLMDLLQNEAHAVLDAGVAGDVTSWCRELDSFGHAIRHQSILWLTLMAAAKREIALVVPLDLHWKQRKDLSSAVVVLLTALQYLTEVDPWGHALIAKFLRLTPSLSPRARPEVTKLNLYLLEALSHLLSMAMREGWPTTNTTTTPPPPALVQWLLPRILPRLARLSIPPFSKTLLDAVMTVQRGITAALPEDAGLSLSRAVFRGLCGVLSDPHLDPDLLLHYTNTKATQAYVKTAVTHLADTLEAQILRHKRPLVPALVTAPELWRLVSVLSGLYRLADRSPRDYGFLNFPTVLALTMLIDQHPDLRRMERLEWTIRAHAALAERVVVKELKGTIYLAPGFGECFAGDARFLRFALQAASDEIEAEGGDIKLQDLAHEVVVQCLRCLYKIEIGRDGSSSSSSSSSAAAASATLGCADHGAPERRPKDLQECLALAHFCTRFMEKQPGRSRPAMKTALRLVYQEPVFREPPIALHQFIDVIDRFLFRGVAPDQQIAGGAQAGAVAVPSWLTCGVRDDEDDEDISGDDVSSYVNHDKLDAMVQDPSLLLYVYRRLYRFLGDLGPAPRRKRGSQDTESYHAYELDCLTTLHIHLNDLRFNPRSVTAWLGLTEAVTSLLLLYLDHCPPFLDETASALALEARLRQPDAPSLAPFLSTYIGYKTSPPAHRLRACLAGTPLVTFLPAPSISEATAALEGGLNEAAAAGGRATPGLDAPTTATTTGNGPSSATTTAAAPVSEEEGEDLDLTWAFMVSAAYRVLLERCLGVMTAMLDRLLADDPKDDTAARERVEMSMRLAGLAYMRRYNFNKTDVARQLPLLQETLKHVQHAQAIESDHSLSRPRWDIPYFLGKLLEKTRLLQHPGRTYADIDRLEPAWLSTLLAYYQRALDLAETKASRTAAFYRLHATRLRILRADLRPGDVALPPNPDILKLLKKYPVAGGLSGARAEADQLSSSDDEGGDVAAVAGVDASWLSRWSIIRECLTAMVQCREKEKWDARSVYCRARTVHQLPGWEPPGLREGGGGQEVLKGLYAGLCRPDDAVGEARDIMVQLFDKRRPQIIALWMPDECKDYFEIVNQRNRKYESLRWRYTDYYLSLLRTCEDYPHVLELYKWLRGGSGKDPSLCVKRINAETSRTLVHVLQARLGKEPPGSGLLRGLLEVCYDLYLDLMEEHHHHHPPPIEAQQAESLLAAAEPMLVQAWSKVTTIGGGDVASAGMEEAGGEARLEQALKYCHEVWPVKQGESKLDKIKSGRRRRRRRSTTPGADQQHEGSGGIKRHRSSDSGVLSRTGTPGGSVAAPEEDGMDLDEEDEEEADVLVRRRRLPEAPFASSAAAGMEEQDDDDDDDDDGDIVLNDAAEGSAALPKESRDMAEEEAADL